MLSIEWWSIPGDIFGETGTGPVFFPFLLKIVRLDHLTIPETCIFFFKKNNSIQINELPGEKSRKSISIHRDELLTFSYIRVRKFRFEAN